MMKLAHLQHRLDDLSTKPMLSAILSDTIYKSYGGYVWHR